MKLPLSLLSALTVLPFIAGCKKEPDVVIQAPDGKVVAVKDKNGDGVVRTEKEVIVVKDTATIQPAVEETIRAQARMLNARDIDGYMSYIHPDSGNYGATRDAVADEFDTKEMRYTVEKLTPVSIQEDEVKMDFAQLVEQTAPITKSVRMTGQHTLRRDNGKWKVFDTKLASISVVSPDP